MADAVVAWPFRSSPRTSMASRSSRNSRSRLGIAAVAVALLSSKNCQAAQVVSFRGSLEAPDASNTREVAAVATAAATAAAGGDHDDHFDFYVMSMSFQPEFCYEHRSQHYDGCSHPDVDWRGSLTIHGLWPERNVSTMNIHLCFEHTSSHKLLEI